MASTSTSSIEQALSNIAYVDWGDFGFVALLFASLFKSASLFSQYRKENAQGDATAIDRWDNELFSRAIVPLYLRIEESVVDFLVEEGIEDASFDVRMLTVKRRTLERTGIQSYQGFTDFHDALDEIHNKKSNSRKLERMHIWNKRILLLILIASAFGLIMFVATFVLPQNLATLSKAILLGLLLLITTFWGVFILNQTRIDRLQYGKS